MAIFILYISKNQYGKFTRIWRKEFAIPENILYEGQGLPDTQLLAEPHISCHAALSRQNREAWPAFAAAVPDGDAAIPDCMLHRS
ncbi:MAG: hypothetical protein E7022_02290 [Desulfovibrio desulfuricans]|nr:hypothetical protein [Desulfovibrio desulfuricans]